MCKLRNNEKGFGAVEGLLIVVIVVLIGVVGWFVYKNHNKTTNNTTTSNTATTAPTKTASTPQSVDPYAGWKTYTSPDEKFTLKYPTDWTVSNESASGILKESIDLWGPNNFRLNYTLVKYDSTFTVSEAQKEAQAVGNPDPVKDNAYNVISNFTPNNLSKALYVVSTSSDVGEAGGPVNNIEVAEYKTYQGQPLGYPGYYVSKNNTGYMVQWYGGYSKLVPSYGPVGMPTTTFLAKSEVKTATLILKSVSY